MNRSHESKVRERAGLPHNNHEVKHAGGGMYECRSCDFVGDLTDTARHVAERQPDLRR